MGVIKDILRTMDYGPSPEGSEHVRAWLDEHAAGFGHFIGGAFTKPHDLFDVFNPATGERIARRDAGLRGGHRRRGRRGAEGASRNGRRSPASSGRSISTRWRAMCRSASASSRFLETIDNGKPIRESRDIDIPLVARHFYHHAGWASLIESEFPGTKPVGVCGQIIPWNFPLLMLAWKIAPALAAGNTVVLKPAEYTPLTALAFAAICVEAGLPAGVVNIVTGDGATGAALVAHAGVDKIAFTGSTEVGRAIRKATAGTGKKLSLELGGKSPFIVFEDADLDSAVEGVVDAIWFNQGQVCCAGSRLLVAESVAEALYAKLRARMAKLRVGDPLDKSTDVGAIVAPVQLERIKRLMREGEKEGLEFFRADDSLPARGCFYPPTLVTGVEPASILAREEIFGPVLVATTFRTPGRSGRARQQHPLWPRGFRLDRERQSRARGRGAHQGRASSGSIRPTCSTPPRASAAIAKAASAARAGERASPSTASPTSRRRSRLRPSRRASTPRPELRPADAGNRPDRQALHRRQAGASRTPAIATRSSTPPAARSGLPASATARISATRSRRRPRLRPGARRRRTIARRCSTTSPRI